MEISVPTGEPRVLCFCIAATCLQGDQGKRLCLLKLVVSSNTKHTVQAGFMGTHHPARIAVSASSHDMRSAPAFGR